MCIWNRLETPCSTHVWHCNIVPYHVYNLLVLLDGPGALCCLFVSAEVLYLKNIVSTEDLADETG